MYKIKTTKDGSSTIVSPYSDETYHSMGGAISESMYVYIENGLLYTLKNVKGPINILEIGFGTGLNCYLTKLNQTNRTIYYTAIEPFPIPVEIAQSLNYKDIIVKDSNLFDIIHLNSNKLINYKNDFFFKLITKKFESIKLDSKYDLIYFDGFSLNKDSDIWNINNLIKISDLLNQNGTMVTYASNSYLKKALKQVGFDYEVLPGALGKREMIRAKLA